MKTKIHNPHAGRGIKTEKVVGETDKHNSFLPTQNVEPALEGRDVIGGERSLSAYRGASCHFFRLPPPLEKDGTVDAFVEGASSAIVCTQVCRRRSCEWPFRMPSSEATLSFWGMVNDSILCDETFDEVAGSRLGLVVAFV